MGKQIIITKPARFFLVPNSPKQRQYEALRACFVEGISSAEAAKRFGYTPGTLRVMCSHFRKNPSLDFFLRPAEVRYGRPPRLSRSAALQEKVSALRKKNLSVYDIAAALKHDGQSITPAMVGRILQKLGFAKLPRRADEERLPHSAPLRGETSNVQALDLSDRHFHTKFGGLFLFLPYLAKIPIHEILSKADLPGSQMIPSLQAMLSLLGLKLFGNARKSHVMSYVLDEGLALFAGLNVIPKRAFLTEYSCRVNPAAYPQLMSLWFDALQTLKLPRGNSFDLDFHTIPFHGEDALVEKHYVSKRSRRQKGLLAFLARDADHNVICYANAEIRKSEQNDEILAFVEFWKKRTGKNPEELVFDSKLTTYSNLSRLNKRQIGFITLRRRSRKMLQNLNLHPDSAWRRIELPNMARQFRTPLILDQNIRIKDYEGEIREISIKELGHEEPTILLCNDFRSSPVNLISRYAQRMIIENQIADGIDFFHMDALSSTVAMKVNLDLQLTLWASSLYRVLARQIGEGYEKARSRTLFQHFIDATAQIEITEDAIAVYFQKRARNPYLLAAGFPSMHPRIPWMGNRRLDLILG
jgi:transposase